MSMVFVASMQVGKCHLLIENLQVGQLWVFFNSVKLFVVLQRNSAKCSSFVDTLDIDFEAK